MKVFIATAAAAVIMAMPAQASYTCDSAANTLLTDLEEAVTVMEKVNMAAPNEEDVKGLMLAAEIMTRNKDAAMYIDDKANGCKDNVKLMRYRSRAQAIAARLTDFYNELMNSPETMMIMFGGAAK